MGEWSQKVGAAGESLVQEFLQLIGWGSAQRGVTLPCARPEKHQISNAERGTHGIDFLFTYKSPLMDEVLQNVLASVKFTSKPYPRNPTSKFKEHFMDITATLECFRNSERRRETMSNRTSIRDVHDSGILFWLSNARGSYDDMISRLQTCHLPDDNAFGLVHVVDTQQIAFVYDSVIFAQRRFPNATLEFYYHDTGKNMNPLTNAKSGPILPVEYIKSPVLAFRVEPLGLPQATLMLYLNDSFGEDALRRMIGLARSLSGSWASYIYVCFPDYNALAHSNSVQAVKAGFEDKKITDRAQVLSFRPTVLNLQD